MGDTEEAIDAMIESKDFSVLKKIPNRMVNKIAPDLYRWSTWTPQAKLAWMELRGDKFTDFVDEIVKPLKELNDETVMNDPLIKGLVDWAKKKKG